jgi:hypothetical protein
MQKTHIIADIILYQKCKLTIRSLISSGRKEVWSRAKKLDCFSEERVQDFLRTKRQPGQPETSWALRISALEALCSGWKEKMKLDPDVFAIINDDELYGKGLFRDAHQYTPEEYLNAVEKADGEIAPFLLSLYNFVYSCGDHSVVQ